MKKKINFQNFLVSIMLIIAGILSPSNGLDDRTYKTPFEIIKTVCLIVAVSLTIYVIWTFIENRISVSKDNSGQKKEKP
jgi:uncharacterized membrane protein (DUF4010 family)